MCIRDRIIASNNPALEFQPSSGSGISWGDWGSTKALDYAAVDSVQLRDDDGVAEPEEGFLCMLFNSQEDIDSYNIIDFYRWRILVIEDEGALSLQKHPASAAADDSGIVVTEEKPYLLTVVRKEGVGAYGDDKDFQWTLRYASPGKQSFPGLPELRSGGKAYLK